MQISHFFSSIFLYLIFFSPIVLQAQEIRENAQGEKIIVYPDGRVEYFNGDKAEDNANTPAYPVFNGYIEPLDGSIAINEADLFKIGQRRIQLSTAASKLAKSRLTKAEENLFSLNQQFDKTKDNPEQLAILQKQILSAQRVLEQSRSEALEAKNTASSDISLNAKGGYIEAFNTRQQQSRLEENQNKEIRSIADQSYAQLIPLMDNSIAGVYEDLLKRPPFQACQFDFEGQDNEKNLYRRDGHKELLFTFTDERLRPFLKDKEYLVCEAYLSSLGGYRYLTLAFTFAYPNAREAYGFIDRNSVLTIKLLNGDYVNLRAGQMDRGKYNTVKKELTYSMFYPIDRSLINILKASELDIVRVFWSSGYEEYSIQQMDFFQRQLQCLGD